MKWWWRYCKGDDQLWKRVISFVHELLSNFITLNDLQKLKHGPLSEIYVASQKVSWFNDILKNAFQIRVGRGSRIRFWKDIWIGSSTLKETFPRLFSISLQQSHTISEVDIWDGHESLYQWEFPLLGNLNKIISSLSPPIDHRDQLVWSLDLASGFSVQSFNHLASYVLYK